MKKILIIFVVVIVIQGCMTTAYRPLGGGYGYSEIQLDENVFKVQFKGNSYTSTERTADFTLMRCAELTLKKGYKFFVIIDTNSYTKNSITTLPTMPNSIGGQTFLNSKPSSTNTIVCFKEKPNSGFSYNADFVYKNIAQKYELYKK